MLQGLLNGGNVEPDSLWVLGDGEEMEGTESLKHLLRLDQWNWYSALWILMGMDEESVSLDTDGDDGSAALQSIRTLTGELVAPWEDEIDKIDALYTSLSEIWRSGKHPNQNPPSYYIDWAIRKGFSIPWLEWAKRHGLIDSEKFLHISKLAPKKEAAPEATRKHVSDKLAKLNQAAHKFWANADQTDRNTHPDNATVAAWLIEQGFSETLADRAASIVRPEWAPPGRKPEE